MQYPLHIEGVTTHYKALTLPQTLANEVAQGRESILLPIGTSYRGELLLTTHDQIVGGATLVGVTKVKGGFQYAFKNCERFIEFPCKKEGRKVIWDLYYTKDTLMAYPKINLSRWMNFGK